MVDAILCMRIAVLDRPQSSYANILRCTGAACLPFLLLLCIFETYSDVLLHCDTVFQQSTLDLNIRYRLHLESGGMHRHADVTAGMGAVNGRCACV